MGKGTTKRKTYFFYNLELTACIFHRLSHEEFIPLYCLPQNHNLLIIQTFLTHKCKWRLKSKPVSRVICKETSVHRLANQRRASPFELSLKAPPKSRYHPAWKTTRFMVPSHSATTPAVAPRCASSFPLPAACTALCLQPVWVCDPGLKQ